MLSYLREFIIFRFKYKRTFWVGLSLLVFFGILTLSFAPGETTNQRVERELRADPDGVTARRVMMVSLPDGRSLPVNYLREEGLVFIGVDGFWWRQFRGDGRSVEMFIRGERVHGHAKAILDQPDYVLEIFTRLRPKVPAWLPSWLNGKLIVIEVSDA